MDKLTEKTVEYFEKAGIVITDEEKQKLEFADFGLGDTETTGLQILTYVNTQRCCAKELVLFPHQTCPEHYHPSMGETPGKEETFRCRYGEVYLFVEGEPLCPESVMPPEGVYTVYHGIHLRPGDQYTLQPDTKHWFQAGDGGAVISEFSTRSTDELDVFSDPRIVR